MTHTLGLFLILLGSLLCFTAGLGLVRFPDVLSRLHAASKPQVLGVLLALLGVEFTLGADHHLWELILTGVFQLVTIPVGTHLVARRAVQTRVTTPPRVDPPDAG